MHDNNTSTHIQLLEVQVLREVLEKWQNPLKGSTNVWEWEVHVLMSGSINI
jgi:hypothetical protein